MSELKNVRKVAMLLGVAGLAAFVSINMERTGRSLTAPAHEDGADDTARAVSRFYPAAPQAAVVSVQPAVSAQFPSSFDGEMRVSSSGVNIAVRPVRPSGAAFSPKLKATDGSLVYANAFENSDVLYRCTPEKTEEFILVRTPADRSEWSWEIDAGSMRPKVLASGAVEWVDKFDVSHLTISAPEGRDAGGNVLRCGERLRVSIADSANGKSRLTLKADLRNLAFPVVIDPSWTKSADLKQARADHTATVLPGGKVLVAGGQDNTGAIATCELYDPVANTWTFTGPLNVPRYNHYAVLLNDGTVLVGGGSGTAASSELKSAEIYVPSTGTWTLVASMVSVRQQARAVLLQDHSVLVIGGIANNSNVSTNERFTPAAANVPPNAGSWAATGAMATARELFSATLLPSGKVLVAGGTPDGTIFLTSAELYDPSGVGTFSNITAPMISGRFKHQAFLLKDLSGVLLVGGFNNGLFPSAEIYNIASNSFVPSGSMSKARTEHRIAMLSDGKILAVGCHDGSFAQVDLFDPAAGGTWALTGSTLTPHTRHQLMQLADGRAIVIGGYVGNYSVATEIFDPHSEPVTQNVVANASNPLSITLQAVSIDDSGATTAKLTSPSHGVISGTEPNLVYTSDPGYSGPDSFTFNSSDEFLASTTTGTINITVNSLVPTISSTSPDAAIAGSGGFTVAVNGSNFVKNSVVKWNGSPRPTTFVSTTQLTAVIAASDVSIAGNVNVTVSNTTPGGGTSAPQTFNVLGGALGQWIVTTIADSGFGSLRMAMNDARSGDSIIFDTTLFNLVNSNAATVINLLTPLPLMDKGSVTIDASNVRVAVNGSGAGSAYGLQMVSNANTVLGLTLIGFTKDGILINNANNNIIGGGRSLPAVGTGPNGQGLRISGCGAFGIEIAGTSSGNVVKGCWIGLDASGSAPEGNLAGVLIQSGANSANQIGSLVSSDEANVISGNSFEGITVSGTSTNNNIIAGNVVGASALVTASRGVGTRDDVGGSLGGRSDAGNGSAGVFLSKGTSGTQVGGDTGQTNAIGFNGGNGVEVRASTSKFNSSKRNGISKSKHGGIALFDGSNNGILPPFFDRIIRTDSGGRDAATRANATIHVDGHAAKDGAVEVYSDPENQGGTLLGRTSCVGGQWSIDASAPAGQNVTATLTDTQGNTSSFALFGPPPTFPTPVITSSLTTSAIVGISYSYTLVVGGAVPITFQATGLPDGLTLNGNVITGTPTTAGTYMVHLTASNSSGADSQTLIIAVISQFTTDTDNDGVPDWLEILAGTDPSDATVAPIQTPLSVDKAQFKLSASGAADSVVLNFHLTLPTGTVAQGGSANVQVGTITKSGITFNVKGMSPKAPTSISVKASPRSGSTAIAFYIQKDNLRSGLAPFGFVDTTTDVFGTSLTVPVAIALTANGKTYVGSAQIKVLYKAKKGKGGSARK